MVIFCNVIFSYILLSINLIANPTMYGILNTEAPSFGNIDWVNVPVSKNLEIQNLRGKTVYIYCFQSWCPGCHRYGFPALIEFINEYKDNPDVKIIALQTTFEGFESNGIDDAKKVIEKYNLTIPVGQSGSEKKQSGLMHNYRTGGTPWTIIVDPMGIVRFNDFHIDINKAVTLVNSIRSDYKKSVSK